MSELGSDESEWRGPGGAEEWREMEIRGSMFAVRRSPEGPEADFETSLIFPRRHSRKEEGGGC